ncbi:hypothetical protein [Pseudonocardia sp. H11422]|uniref:hypothetical protein n=1 Tax=Pseudonocardia sp. H11422 TaxID=2835866 RepID=UPI001BDC3D22|nr:hypothetical protein [Pseudonocardia sp. H11422]
MLDRVAGRFARVETRRRFAGLLRGMLAELPIAEPDAVLVVDLCRHRHRSTRPGT